MEYTDEIKIESVTYSDDGAGGQIEDSRSVVYEGKADAQDTSELDELRDVGLEAEAIITFFLPEDVDNPLRGASKDDRITWKDQGMEGKIYKLAYLDHRVTAVF